MIILQNAPDRGVRSPFEVCEVLMEHSGELVLNRARNAKLVQPPSMAHDVHWFTKTLQNLCKATFVAFLGHTKSNHVDFRSGGPLPAVLYGQRQDAALHGVDLQADPGQREAHIAFRKL